jgi:hypothetical protein
MSLSTNFEIRSSLALLEDIMCLVDHARCGDPLSGEDLTAIYKDMETSVKTIKQVTGVSTPADTEEMIYSNMMAAAAPDPKAFSELVDDMAAEDEANGIYDHLEDDGTDEEDETL